jgi:N-acetylglutamate synthase-like GNAT family acetyltransferase
MAASCRQDLKVNTESELSQVQFQVREKTNEDMKWIVSYMKGNWGSEKIVTRNKIYDTKDIPGFIAVQNEKPVGIALYNIENNECEMILLESFIEKIGIGSTLIDYVKKVAMTKDCKRLWLITTNDNTHAIRFYQLREFSLVAIYRNALEESRKLKPEIPLKGIDGIPLKDEIELELLLK